MTLTSSARSALTSQSALALSVVVPSFNRQGSLVAFLTAVESQTLTPDVYEIIIVLDGCTDGSAAWLEQWAAQHPGFNLRVIEQRNAGQSTARSHGARLARGLVLLFLDDDIVPGPECFEIHVHRHRLSDGEDKCRDGGRCVVLGDAWMIAPEAESYYAMLTRMWWEDYYVERAQRQPYSSYRDFCSSHVSLSRDLFFDVGGFDSQFQGYGGEDYELGYRLLKAGARFHLEPNAKAEHHHIGSTRQVLRNLIDEGCNDVRLGRKHPELLADLRCVKTGPATRLVQGVPLLFNGVIKVASGVLDVCEKLQLWHAWRWLLGKSRFIAYSLGVRTAFPSRRAYRRWLTDQPEVAHAVLDITDGLPADLSNVWLHGPSRITLYAHGKEVGNLKLALPPLGPLAQFLADAIAEQYPELSSGLCLSSSCSNTHRDKSHARQSIFRNPSHPIDGA